jgi:hypothetical protein
MKLGSAGGVVEVPVEDCPLGKAAPRYLRD